MNCKPGDLAYVVGVPKEFGINDRVVLLKKEPCYYIGSNAYWTIEGTVIARVTGECRDARRVQISAGSESKIHGIADIHLRPIRDPGDDAVDQIVELIGVAPKTLTEVREVSHG